VRRRGSHICQTVGSHTAVRLSALRAGRPLTPRKIPVRGCVDPRAIARLEGLGQLKNQMTIQLINQQEVGEISANLHRTTPPSPIAKETLPFIHQWTLSSGHVLPDGHHNTLSNAEGHYLFPPLPHRYDL
jgi:hypothetical protein